MRSHDLIERRSLALHDAVATKLESEPSLLTLARANLARWCASGGTPVLFEWLGLLDSLSVPELASLLRSSDERATRLRQSSPFAGVLSMRERQEIFERYDPRRP